MRVVLTSFRDAKNWRGTSCSIARWQPDWSTMPEFPVNIKPIWERTVLNEYMRPAHYRAMYEKILDAKKYKLIELFSMVEQNETLVLCCWCNPDRQKRKDGKLFCHRILLGWWIEEYFQYARVIYADGAEKPIWKR